MVPILLALFGVSAAAYYIYKKRAKKTKYYFIRHANSVCQKCCQMKKKCCNLQTCSFEIVHMILDNIKSSKKSLLLCSPSFSHNSFKDAILQANKNNVRIRVITSHIETMIDVCAKGVTVKGYDCKESCYLMHNKFIVIDDEILIRCSLNFTTFFLQGNCDNVQVIYDKKTIMWYQTLFNEMWCGKYTCLACTGKVAHPSVNIVDNALPSTRSLDMSAVPNKKLIDGRFMPTFGLGTWQADPGVVGNAVRLAIDAGYRHIDCALLYQNEQEIGKAIRDKIAEGVVKREDLFITSKLWNTYHRPDLVVKGCKKTLRNFGLDYIDLYLVHWPFGFQATDLAEAESKELGSLDAIMADVEFWPRNEKGELIFSDDDYVDTWKEMENCVKLGLTKSIGVSNFNVKQLNRILNVAKIPPVNNQIEIHPYLTQKDIREFCNEKGITVTAYCPLGSSRNDLGYTKILDNPTVLKIGAELKKTPAQIVLRYLVQLGVIVIPKSTNPDRLVKNFQIFDFELNQQQYDEMAALDTNKRTCIMAGCESHKYYPF